jgi:hypothetical protein
MENDQVAVRLRSGKNLGAMSLPDFVARAREAIDEKRDD